MYLVKSPFWLRLLYPSLTWHKNRKEKSIYLTFDDGPVPVVTSFVLKTLESFDIKATFFCIGDNIIENPGLYHEIVNNGHQVGNHTHNHLNGWQTTDAVYIENIEKCSQLMASSLFRPPYGSIKKSQISNLKSQASNWQIIMWDVLSGDFDQKTSPQKCLENVVKNTENGSVIVFHDSVKAFPRLEFALPRSLEFLKQKGYRFKVL